MKIKCPFCRTENIFPDTVINSHVCGRCKKIIMASEPKRNENSWSMGAGASTVARRSVADISQELDKPNPNLTPKELGHLFYLGVVSTVSVVMRTKSFLDEMRIKKNDKKALDSEVCCLYLFAYRLVLNEFANKVFADGVFSEMLDMYAIEQLAARGLNAEMAKRCYQDAAVQYEQGLNCKEDERAISGIGMQILSRMHGKPLGPAIIDGSVDALRGSIMTNYFCVSFW